MHYPNFIHFIYLKWQKSLSGTSQVPNGRLFTKLICDTKILCVLYILTIKKVCQKQIYMLLFTLLIMGKKYSFGIFFDFILQLSVKISQKVRFLININRFLFLLRNLRCLQNRQRIRKSRINSKKFPENTRVTSIPYIPS